MRDLPLPRSACKYGGSSHTSLHPSDHVIDHRRISAGPVRAREPAPVSSTGEFIPGQALSAPLRAAGYLVLLLAVIFPLLDTFAALTPATLDNATWRFGALGLISNAIMGLSLELFLLAVVATLSNQRRVLLTLAVVSLVVGVLLLGSSVLFTLDMLQTRAKVTPMMKHRFDFASAGALAKLLFYGIANFLLARGELVLARPRSKSAPRVRGMVSPVIGGQAAEGGRGERGGV